MDEMRPADYAAMNGNGFGNNNMWPWLMCNNGGLGGFGGGGIFWIVILFVFAMFGWGGNGWGGNNGGGSIKDAYVLSSDFATIQRQLSDGFNGLDNAMDRQNAGLCDLGYTQAQLINGVGNQVMQTGNAIQSQIAGCCCDIRDGIANVNYNMATNTNMLSRDVERGFCETQYRDAQNTNALMQAGHGDADRIIARLDAMEMSRKDEKIAEQNQELFRWQLKASQESQTAQLLRELGYQCPKPAYVVQPPQQVSFRTNCCGQTGYDNGGCSAAWGA